MATRTSTGDGNLNLKNLSVSTDQAASRLSRTSNPRLAVFAADYWEHACPMIRVILPAKHSGVEILKGTAWVNDQLTIDPDQINSADLVMITRDFPRWHAEYRQVIERARAQGKPVIYELDDLLLELPREHEDYEHYLPTNSALLQAIVEADVALGASEPICDYLRQYNPQTVLWENYLDDHLWQFDAPIRASIGDPVRIGYMGGHSHQTDIELISAILEKILIRFQDRVKLVFWGAAPTSRLSELPNVEWLPVAFVSYEEFVRYFSKQQCDIFIAPLTDSRFNRCKSHIKYLEYSALGAPGIFSKITPYERVIQHGINGFLASNVEDWEVNLLSLINEPDLQFQMAVNAQEDVRKRWLLSNHAHQWADMLAGFASLDLSSTNRVVSRAVARKMLDFQNAQNYELIKKIEENARLNMLSDQIAEKNQIILELERAARKYAALYEEVITSKSWQIMERLIRLRLKLIPRSSKREQFLGAILRPILVLRHTGIRGMSQQIRVEMENRNKPQPAPQSRIQFHLMGSPVLQRLQLELPIITIIVIQEHQVELREYRYCD